MPSFSFTAPIVTLDQERQEWQELTTEEREEIQRDVYGEVMTTTTTTTAAVGNPTSPADVDDDNDNEEETSSATDNLVGSVAMASTADYDEDTDADNSRGQQQQDEEESLNDVTCETRQQKKINEMMKELRDALMEVPDREKNDLVIAMDVVPELVYKESNISRYTRMENGKSSSEVEEAAKRIASYWKTRTKVFGPIQALKPMTLFGAMEDVGIQCLQKGIVTILPNDECGRAVIFFDRIRAIPAIATRETVLKILFYMLQKAFYDDESTGKLGFVFIENINGYDLYTHFDRLLSKNQMIILRDCFPCKLKAYHVWGGASGGWAIDLISPVIKQLAGKEIRLRMVCHTKADRSFSSTYKFNPNHLSVLLGGCISYSCHLRWIERMAAVEQVQECIKPSDRSWSGLLIGAENSARLLSHPQRQIVGPHASSPSSSSSSSFLSQMMSPSPTSNRRQVVSIDAASLPTVNLAASSSTLRGRSRLNHVPSLDNSFHTSRTFKSSEGPRAA